MSVENILRFYDRATDHDRIMGEDWYPVVTAALCEYAEQTGYTLSQVADVFALASINTPWKRNFGWALRAITLRADDEPLTGHLSFVIRGVTAILSRGASIDDIIKDKRKRKIRNFARNFAGDMYAVTVDRWAYRIATSFADCKTHGVTPCVANGRHGCGMVPEGAAYDIIADEYIEAAYQRGVTPAVMQAVTWIVARGSGE